jgi:REP element-mobilizing transposase RayT
MDDFSGVCHEHRRQWLEDRLHDLAKWFAIDIAAYAIMSNHYHLVLHINRENALAWSDIEVVTRWHNLFSGTTLSQDFLAGGIIDDTQKPALNKLIACWRGRLMDISWFMRCMNENIARRANQEDKVSGRFWEGRFKSQALLDEKALIACMAYVDLNPVRAKMATTPEASAHTSIRERIHAYMQTTHPQQLMPFADTTAGRARSEQQLPLDLQSYLDLVDCTGRIIRENKAGAISRDALPILDRLGIPAEHWFYLTKNFHRPFKNLVGRYFQIKNACSQLGLSRAQGSKACTMYFGT